MQQNQLNITPFKSVVDDQKLISMRISQMYLKSNSKQNLTITTKYSEMVTEIFPHFEHNHLPEFGKECLWF